MSTPTDALHGWLVQWHREGGAARLSQQTRAQVEAWLDAGADVTGPVQWCGPQRTAQALELALRCPELCELLIAHGARPEAELPQVVAERCEGWEHTHIEHSQRQARQDEQQLWRKFAISLAQRWPDLDWYAMRNNPLLRPAGAVGRRQVLPRRDPRRDNAEQLFVPTARAIEYHIPGFIGHLERAREQAGLPIGVVWATQDERDRALLDLLLPGPELYAFSGRERIELLRDVMAQGANPAAQGSFRRAVELGDAQVVGALLGAGLQPNPEQLQWFGQWITGGAPEDQRWRLHDFHERRQMVETLLLDRAPLDWDFLVATPEGARALHGLADEVLGGIYAQTVARRMEQNTRTAKGRRSTGRL